MLYLSDRGGAANEDFVVAGRDREGRPFGVLVDGATGLFPSSLFSATHASDAQWLAHEAGAIIARQLAAGALPAKAVERAAESCRERFERACGGDIATVDRGHVPSATVSVACVRDGALRLAWLGDSPIALSLAPGHSLAEATLEASDGAPACAREVAPSLFVLSCDDLSRLDARARRLMVERTAGKRLSAAEKRAAIDDVLRAHRRLANRPNGYFNFDPTGAGLPHLNELSVRLDAVRMVAGFSDGLFAAFDLYGMGDLADFLATVDHARALALIDRMRVVEACDPDLDDYPRFKQGDDASLFVLDLATT